MTGVRDEDAEGLGAVIGGRATPIGDGASVFPRGAGLIVVAGCIRGEDGWFPIAAFREDPGVAIGAAPGNRLGPDVAGRAVAGGIFTPRVDGMGGMLGTGVG